MSDGGALGPDDLALMCRVVACWTRTSVPTGDNFLDRRMADFPVVQWSQLIRAVPRPQQSEIDLSTYGWLGGLPLARVVPPVATRGSLRVRLSPDDSRVLKCTIRVALFRVRADGTLHADGWRFEMAEMPLDGASEADVVHPYQHSQAIVGWHPSRNCLLHPPHQPEEDCPGIDSFDGAEIDTERAQARDGTHVGHPAFPLASTTVTGLAAVALTSLYGAPRVREMLMADASIFRRARGPVREDLERLHLTP